MCLYAVHEGLLVEFTLILDLLTPLDFDDKGGSCKTNTGQYQSVTLTRLKGQVHCQVMVRQRKTLFLFITMTAKCCSLQ